MNGEDQFYSSLTPTGYHALPLNHSVLLLNQIVLTDKWVLYLDASATAFRGQCPDINLTKNKNEDCLASAFNRNIYWWQNTQQNISWVALVRYEKKPQKNLEFLDCRSSYGAVIYITMFK